MNTYISEYTNKMEKEEETNQSILMIFQGQKNINGRFSIGYLNYLVLSCKRFLFIYLVNWIKIEELQIQRPAVFKRGDH